MAEGFLLQRMLLRFGAMSAGRNVEDLRRQLSAVAFDADGALWLGADEGRWIERLGPTAPGVYSSHAQFPACDFVPLANAKDEIDIEAFDFDDGYLWLSGSHSSKRRKPRPAKPAADNLARLAEVRTEANRFLIARIPVQKGALSVKHGQRVAARVAGPGDDSPLLHALADDAHLGAFVRANIPSKDNGLDIEGLAVSGLRAWLGLRGPVLRGYAVVLEVEFAEDAHDAGILHLAPGEGPPYRKHFLNLAGLGVRDLRRDGEDLLLLAGPTMALEGFLRVYRWRGALSRKAVADTLTEAGAELEALFDLPFGIGDDRAEGIALTRWHADGSPALLVVYDTPAEHRIVGSDGVIMDLYRLP